MKVSGFTFVKNAIKFDYPIVEAINSILPICDEVIVAIGKSDDDTKELIASINSPKIKIIETVWNESLREGGMVLADETNKAFDAIASDSDWAFYIQGDEVVHEKYLPTIKAAMLKWKDNQEVEGLLFNYRHFFGSYDYIGNSRSWYRSEIRVVRNIKTIRSYKDAQGFRINNEKLKVKPIDAYMYHYGWVKHPKDQQAKHESFHKLWHDDNWVEKNVKKVEEFDYAIVESLAHFTETHPTVMQQRIDRINWKYTFDPTKKKMSFKAKFLFFMEKYTGWRVGEYKNYKTL